MKKIRCAIYTRKSSEDGLEQAFNSLHAQREACAAYVASQKHEGWVLLPDAYDDGGLSGGSLERPALQQLLADVGAGRADQIVVYKIDRLTRSLADFAKIVDVLDAAGASFVSVTQSFNTATSMGRLTLNMLLSFAQFEREVTAERIRDKIAASKRKGLWMGGQVPLGYDADGRTLKIREGEAATIRMLYDLYERFGTVRAVKEETDHLGLRTRRRETATGRISGGGHFDRGHIHQILINPLYAGRIRHRDKVHDGQHPAIIDPARWDAIQVILQEGASRTRSKKVGNRMSHLCGKLFDETGDRLTPSHSKTKSGARLRYYISHRLVARSGEAKLDGWRLPAVQLEARVADLVRAHLGDAALPGRLAAGSKVADIVRLQDRLKQVSAWEPAQLLSLTARVTVAPGEITVAIDPSELAAALDLDPDTLVPGSLHISTPFQLRRRGVESRLMLGDAPAGRDDILIRNIALANTWFEQIRAGRNFNEIATASGVSKTRVQHMIDLAFLAPDLLRDVMDGRQPVGFTSEWCVRHSLPSDWADQRKLLATL